MRGRHALWALCGLVAGLLPAIATAQEAKFTRLDGGVLLYDTETIEDDPGAEIDEADIDILRRYLSDDATITTLRLHSYGGSVWAGFRLADLIIDFGLDTEVVDDCASACTLMFLAGKARRMERGARLGFHNWKWSKEAIMSYYERRKEAEGWDDPFDFAAWLYVDTQYETEEVLRYYLERGMAPGFAIELLSEGRDALYYPRRDDLEAAGVLRD
jgi:hypothetical protein